MSMPDLIVTESAEDGLAESDFFVFSYDPKEQFATNAIRELVSYNQLGIQQQIQRNAAKCRYGDCFGICSSADVVDTPYGACIISKGFGPSDVTEHRLQAIANLLQTPKKSILTPFEYFVEQYLSDAPDWFSGGLYLEINPTKRNLKMVEKIFENVPILNIFVSKCPFGYDQPYEEIFPSWKTPKNLASLIRWTRTTNQI